MADCYITSTGSYLPGKPVDNESINQYLGKIIGEAPVQNKILAVNGIQTRHYALDKKQNATHSIPELASEAVKDCPVPGLIIFQPAQPMRQSSHPDFPRFCMTS